MNYYLGIRMGWICVHYKPDSTARILVIDYGSLLVSFIYELHCFLHTWFGFEHANTFCWFSTNQDQ